MQERRNRRGIPEHFCEHRHLKLIDLKRKAAHLNNQYLRKENIPESPKAEFQVFHLKHDTTTDGLYGIRNDEGFRYLYRDGVPLIWWSLAVKPEEIQSAETRLLKKTFPDRTEEQASMQQSFLSLWKFTTSPAFLETSRLGPYRFTFPLKEVLMAYRQQFCSGDQPFMRVYETVLYKQEVMHVVLVHSPTAKQDFSKYPLLSEEANAFCVYKDDHFIWRPEAMSETHSHELIIREDTKQMEAKYIDSYHQYYVWNHMAVAFHVPNEQEVLMFEVDQLRKNLKFCRESEVKIDRYVTFETLEQAQDVVKDLWRDMNIPLEEEQSLAQSFTEVSKGNRKRDRDTERQHLGAESERTEERDQNAD